LFKVCKHVSCFGQTLRENILEEFFENELARRFEEMIENNEEFYFDTAELIDIIIYYLELGDINYAELAVQHATKLHPNSA